MISCLYVDAGEPGGLIALETLLTEYGFRFLDVTDFDDAARQSRTLEDVASIYGMEYDRSDE